MEATVAGFPAVVVAVDACTGAVDAGSGFLDVSSVLILPACSRQIRKLAFTHVAEIYRFNLVAARLVSCRCSVSVLKLDGSTDPSAP